MKIKQIAIVLIMCLVLPIIPSFGAAAETEVYITKTGSKYHSGQCGSGTYFKATLSEAEKKGLTPCSKCWKEAPVPSKETPVTESAKVSTNTGDAGSKDSASSKVKISQDKLYTETGSKTTLKVLNLKEAATVKWSSSKKSVATVSSKGVVKAVAEGTATITAKVGTKKYKCKVTVLAPAEKGAKNLVWIPTKGGVRYHSTATCSGMIDPIQVTKEQAEKLGFTPCGKSGGCN